MKASRDTQERLLALQQVDSDLIQISHKMANLPVIKQVDEASKSLSAKRDLLTAAQTEHDDIKHELTRSEVDVEQVTSRIERDEKRLASGQGTPKELEQLQHELGTLGKRRAELEEVELEIMMRLDGVAARIKELSSECGNLEQEISNLTQKRDLELAELEKAKANSQSERTLLATELAGELLSLYEKIRASADGVGAARLAGNQCMGCHLTLNSAEVGRIKGLSDDEVVRCEECRRILVRVG